MDAWEQLNAESRAAWNANADHWDAYMGDEGNDFQKTLVALPTRKLLDLQPGETVLDIGCGNGIFARRMAEAGVRVVAFDFSEQMIACAQARNADYADRITYVVLDATDTAGLLSLGERCFDAAVSTMALMDMPVIAPLYAALSRLLKAQGRFVFSVMHPCFNTSGTSLTVEESDIGGEMVTQYAVKVFQYRTLAPAHGLGLRDQPVPQRYFHRPLHAYLNAGFEAGFALDGLEEPTFPPEGSGSRRPSWDNFPEISWPACVSKAPGRNRTARHLVCSERH